MFKAIKILFTLITTSFFFFPFVFTFFPIANTKMILAAMGLVIFGVKLVLGEKAVINKDMFVLSLLALGVSFVSFVTMTLNNTPDSSYLGYIVSMWVWLGAAYFVVNMIKWSHGTISVELVCSYLITVGVFQCLLAIVIDTIPNVKIFVDSILDGEGFMGKVEGRLYGLGCALDVAGSRFSALLLMVGFLLYRVVNRKGEKIYIFLLMIAFCIIAIIGNFIGRTTTIGLFLTFAFLVYLLLSGNIVVKEVRVKLVKWILSISFLLIIASVYLYNYSLQWRDYFEFGFEGFFSLVNEGHWSVHSNDMLKSHYIFPDNLRGWIIGDGRMASTDIDPYYTGDRWEGFYKGSDVGYVRFIFYFGVVGLIAFSIFMIKVCQVCIKRFPDYRMMFLLLLAVNFIVWLKVSTDIFLVFAPFLCISQEENEAYMKHAALKGP